MIDYSLTKIIPAEESHREFSYQVKKTAEGDYITQLWGWDETVQRNFHTSDWQQKRPSIILYDGVPVGTIYILENDDIIQIGQFFIMPYYQNKGIGSYLLKNILDKADRYGKLTKIAYLKNNPVVSLYERNGFETVEVHDVYCRMERKPNVVKVRYKAVIFDLFGTLIDNFIRSEYEAVLAEMADILGVPWEKFIRMWFDTFRERNTGQFTTPQANIEFICEELNIKATPRQIEQAARKRLDYTVRSMKPRPGTLEALTALRSMGYRTGLISDCSGEIPIVWSKTQLAPFFDTTVFSCVAGVKKPDPRIYKMATDRLGVVPQECLYIGDGGSNELTGASQVGMYAVLLRDPAEPADAHFIDREEEWDGPVVSSVQEILNLLK